MGFIDHSSGSRASVNRREKLEDFDTKVCQRYEYAAGEGTPIRLNATKVYGSSFPSCPHLRRKQDELRFFFKRTIKDIAENY